MNYDDLPKALIDGRPVVWRTTSPHPGVTEGWKRSHTHGADAGQIGWRLHAVLGGERDIGNTKHEIDRTSALCGLRPAWGWLLDLFIDRPCARCMQAATKTIPEERNGNAL